MKARHSRLKLLGAAVAAAVASPAFAQSSGSVTLYGVVDDAIAYVNNQKGHSNVYLRQGSLYSSRFGIRGSEDLGSGTHAIFDLQAGFDPNNGAEGSKGLLFNREAFVGLQNNQYGTVTMGRQYTSYYTLLGPLGPSSYLTGATGAHPGDIDGLDTTIRSNNSVVYTSPVLYGFQLSGMYGFGGVPGQFQSGSTISAAGTYRHGPLALGVGYLLMHNTGDTGAFSPNATASYGTSAVNAGYVSASSVQHIAASANYTLGNLIMGVNYSNVQYRPGTNSLYKDTVVFNTYGALAKYTFTPAFDVAGGYSYTRSSSANGITDPAKYHQVSLKEAYHLSKRSTIYALQVWQHASGKTLGADGSIIDARPVVGDLNNSMPSSTANQIAVLLGLAVSF